MLLLGNTSISPKHEEREAMTERLAIRYRARLAETRFKRRGGEPRKAPGAVFDGKITDEDRTLAAALAMRSVASRKALADPFRVSPEPFFRSGPPRHTARTRSDDAFLRELGYEPVLTRRMGPFGNFAISGPAVMMWGWLAVGVMVLAVVLATEVIHRLMPGCRAIACAPGITDLSSHRLKDRTEWDRVNAKIARGWERIGFRL
ncbi:hypothetical protein OHU45_37800 [Streptomyces tubercidicus]|uniref:hypothetical protein n=1 Tax=Streptomyces tubercidicus TaxID=47759 RepID=UPI00375762EF